ncbi:hypothetical protein A2U01_0085138, partial [Trifolium medium]|nr:hypothetical protein [Trifolium medium]
SELVIELPMKILTRLFLLLRRVYQFIPGLGVA